MAKSNLSQSRRRVLGGIGTGIATGLTGCTGVFGSSGDENSGPITVGVLAPLNLVQGKDIRDGAKMAAEHINADGGINGRQIETVTKDTQADPATAKSVHRELVVQEGADMTTGIFGGDVMLNVLDSVAEQETVHFTNGAATNDLEPIIAGDYEKYRYHFRTVQDSVGGAENRAAFMKDQFAGEKVAMLYEDYRWTEPFEDVWGSMDDTFDIVYQKRFSGDTENFAPFYDEIEKAGADHCFVAMAFVGTNALLQWARQERDFTFGGNHNFMQSSDYWEQTNGNCQYGWTNTPYLPGVYFNDVTEKFLTSYDTKYGRTPTYTGATAYEAVHVWAEAAKKAGTTAEDDVIPTLESESVPSVLGDIGFYAEGNEKVHDLVYEKDTTWDLMLQWQEDGDSGGRKCVFWDEYSNTEFTLPNWM